MRLTYKNVFDRYESSFTDKLAELSYKVYKKVRQAIKNILPLSEHDEYYFREKNYFSEASADMPKGFDYKERKIVEGILTLDYIDFYDYLPKEDISDFKKNLIKYVEKNKVSPFSASYSRKDLDRIDHHGWFSDGMSLSNLQTLKFQKNRYLREHCSGISISIQNLSTTFSVVKYRIHIGETFNTRIADICKSKYCGYTKVFRSLETPWYAVRKFGKSYYTGDDLRKEHFYEAISELKWQCFKEVRKNFGMHFEKNRLFPPVFETYSTNIRPSGEREKQAFWNSIMVGYETDYSSEYNTCVCWDYRESEKEGPRLAAYCGGDYSNHNHIPGFAHHDISDAYAVYLTAAALERIARRDIAVCNKKINKAIKRKRTTELLKVRVAVERKLYYSYRFISEFSGKAIDFDDVDSFCNEFVKKGSISLHCLKNISKNTDDIKNQIDKLLKILNNAAEYRSSKSNIRLQWMMMIITILSLLIALFSIKDGLILDGIIDLWKMICK